MVMVARDTDGDHDHDNRAVFIVYAKRLVAGGRILAWPILFLPKILQLQLYVVEMGECSNNDLAFNNQDQVSLSLKSCSNN